MSKTIFKSGDFGRYYFFTQLIELNNDKLGISASRASELINSNVAESFTSNEIEFYKTFIHEAVHFLDSTSTLWGIEYSYRLYNCLTSDNEGNYVDVFALNDESTPIS